MYPNKHKKRLWHSFGHAFNGIAYVIRTQPNMQIHLCVAILILILTLVVDIPVSHMIWVIFAVFFVMCMETLNTAIERTVDLVTSGYHPLAKLAKDIAAGTVLFASMFAVITGLFVFAEALLEWLGITVTVAFHPIMIALILGFIAMLIIISVIKKER